MIARKISTTLLFFFAVTLYIQAQQITILHTNDMHSKLNGFGPENEYTPLTTNDDKTIGGFARLATALKLQKQQNPENTFIVDAGDFLMGTIFHAAEPKTGFQLSLMKQMGYDIVTIGNHEFDYGPDQLANALTAAAKNGLPTIVASNIQFDPKSTADDKLEALMKEKTILPYHIEQRDGLKIAFIGIMGEDASEVAPLKAPVTFPDPIKHAAKLAKALKNEGKADLVVCLSHSGFYFSEQNLPEGEDFEMAEKATDIDVIVSGHTHEKTDKPIKVGNTLIVQTGAYVKNLGKLQLTIKDKKIENYNFELIPLDDKIKGDEAVQQKIDEYQQMLEEIYLNNYNLSYDQVIAQTSFDVMKRHPDGYTKTHLGPLVADAIYYYTNQYGTGADIVMVASGTIRENILKGENGKITPPDVFRIMSLGSGLDDMPGYPIAKIYITANEVKKLMEVLLMSSGDDSYVFYSGIKTFYDPEKGMLRKVYKVEQNGQAMNTSKDNTKLYSIAANTYLLSFIGRVKKMSKGLVKIYPKDEKGNRITDMNKYLMDFNPKEYGVQEGKEWLAVVRYLQQMTDTDNNGIPDLDETYKTKYPNVVAKTLE